MFKIHIDGKEVKSQIINWKIWASSQDKELMVTITYPSNKKFTAAFERCEIYPYRKIKGSMLIFKGQKVVQTIEEAIEYGERYTVIKYPSSDTLYSVKSENIEIYSATNIKNEDVFSYFKSVAKERVEHASGVSRKIAESVASQMEEILSYPDTALHAYCYKNIMERKKIEHFIYPFGVNESQLKAVENAFSSQISIIEGPPGTGKTQTILNIISNIIINKKTVAVISNNNSAVENVYQKMEKENLDYLIARLGNNKNKKNFFEKRPEWTSEENDTKINIDEIDTILEKLTKYLYAKNEIAILISQLDEVKIEKEYLQRWNQDSLGIEAIAIEKYNLSPSKVTELIAYLDYLSAKKIAFKEKIQLLLQFKIIRSQFLCNLQDRNEFIYALQFTYYEKILKEKEEKIKQYEKILKQSNYDKLLDDLTGKSMKYFKNYLSENISNFSRKFSVKDYKKHFEDFMKCFPVIGSSTYSIISSIAKGALLDYIIIDEASQQDIIPGILGLGCAQNIIVVGDRKQLPHIPVESNIICPDEKYDCSKYSLLDSFLEIFKEKVPVALLKEHYRCHPKIIQFCNKQFYDNQLIPMTTNSGGAPLELVITAKGNHTRKFSNLREIESLEEVRYKESEDIGFIAPYNRQVNLAEEYLPQEFVKATIHKFQGRECEEIIFSTVLDKKASSQRNIEFVDNPALVNVAVSRAKRKFTLVTGDGVFEKNNQSIAALIRYMKYYADSGHIYESPVISAFDLLYDEYDKSLQKLNTRLDKNDSRFKSEQIAICLVRDILIKDEFKSLKFHKQILLLQLVVLKENTFSEREIEYMRNRSSCDLVIYYKLGKTPLAVIEVDGGDHERPVQVERDKLKNSILEKAGIPLLRLKTIEGHIEEKISNFLHDSIINGKCNVTV